MRYPSNLCNKRDRDRAGFTLLELIIVLGILAVAASIVSVSIHRAHKKGVLRAEAAKVQGVLRHARDTSLLKKMPVFFVPDTKSNAYWLIDINQKPVGKKRTLAPGLKLEGEEIVFFPKGNSTGGVVRITREDGRGFEITVSEISGKPEARRF